MINEIAVCKGAKMKKVKEYIFMFVTMLKIGLFTFGGGYAMIALLENEFVSKNQGSCHDQAGCRKLRAEGKPVRNGIMSLSR